MIKIPLNSQSAHSAGAKKNARIQNEQDADLLFKALQLRILHEEYDEHLETEPRGRDILRREKKFFYEQQCAHTK